MKTTTNVTYSTLALFAFAWSALAPQAGATCLQGCDTDKGNTFLGDDALSSNTTGGLNTADGTNALANNTTGFGNTAMGFSALVDNTIGGSNTAIGESALG